MPSQDRGTSVRQQTDYGDDHPGDLAGRERRGVEEHHSAAEEQHEAYALKRRGTFGQEGHA